MLNGQNDVTIQDVLSRPVTTGDYSSWTEDQLVREVTNRRLAHGVNINSFPDEKMRMARLVKCWKVMTS